MHKYFYHCESCGREEWLSEQASLICTACKAPMQLRRINEDLVEEAAAMKLQEVKTYSPKTSLVEVVERDASFGIQEGSNETTQELKAPEEDK